MTLDEELAIYDREIERLQKLIAKLNRQETVGLAAQETGRETARTQTVVEPRPD